MSDKKASKKQGESKLSDKRRKYVWSAEYA